MSGCKRILSIGIFFVGLGVVAQTATLTGTVFEEGNRPLENVNISYAGFGAVSDANGNYVLEGDADIAVTIRFSHIGHADVVLENLILRSNETFEFNPVMKTDVVQIDGVEILATGVKSVSGITTISPQLARNIPGANQGVANVLKLLPGVSFNNELSTQYNVRGGNFDENLVYVNGIEVYRPFLVRSAQQEGFSFINSNMIENLRFSAGGFQSKYGDKLSSVLDISYKTPSSFSIQMDASLLGVGGTVEAVSKNNSFTAITGFRYRDNSLLINSQQTETTVNPSFTDIQSYMMYRVSDRFSLGFLGYFAINDYENTPVNRQTNFGTLLDPRALLVFYEGTENNTYQTEFGALKADYSPTENLQLNFSSSIYHATEEEFSDIIATYELGDVVTDLGNENLGEATNTRGIGSQINRARNQLDALIFSLTHKGSLKQGEHLYEWGLRYTREDFRDQLREAEFIDSAGFFIRPAEPPFVNNQPQEPFEADIVPFEGVRATNFVVTDRLSAFAQLSKQTQWGTTDIYYNLGVRGQSWTVDPGDGDRNRQFLFSPRAQFGIKPDWNRDMLFRFAVGSYQQPAFYRELRDRQGLINPEVGAQKSLHLVLGNEYSFTLGQRPFTLVSEAYYKKLSDVNPYTIEDVRVRYAAENNAEAFAYGVDFRLNGAFVPGEESWVSIGYLRTEENIDGRGYISRPTDQRFKLGLLFQDHMPSIPNLKLYLNLVYNTGLPGGSPNNADPYDFQNRLRDYRRADLGISYIFVDGKTQRQEGHWLQQFKEFTLGFEIFNMFNNQNSITNTWVRDVDTQRQFAVPNFLTSRILNLKLSVRI